MGIGKNNIADKIDLIDNFFGSHVITFGKLFRPPLIVAAVQFFKVAYDFIGKNLSARTGDYS